MRPLAKPSLVALMLGLGACAAPSRHDARTEAVASPLLGGRPSGSNENATVFIITGLPTDAEALRPRRCSGTLLAPNLVVTARHCVFDHRDDGVACTSDGDPVGGTAQDLATEDPANITVRWGSEPSELRTAVASQLLAPPDITYCRNDLAFIVLASALAEDRVPLRMDPPVLGEPFRFSGWGYTSDAQKEKKELPSARSSRDGLRVEDVGPGLLPAGSFAIGGGTTCLGDSGGGAWFGDAVGGVYSRIAPDSDACESTTSRNYFSMLAPHRDLIERAFAAAGETPWYAGQPRPGGTQDAGGGVVEDGRRIANEESCALRPAPTDDGSFATMWGVAALAWMFKRRRRVAKTSGPLVQRDFKRIGPGL